MVVVVRAQERLVVNRYLGSFSAIDLYPCTGCVSSWHSIFPVDW